MARNRQISQKTAKNRPKRTKKLTKPIENIVLNIYFHESYYIQEKMETGMKTEKMESMTKTEKMESMTKTQEKKTKKCKKTERNGLTPIFFFFF